MTTHTETPSSADALRAAAVAALDYLNTATSAEFARGTDAPVRALLNAALGITDDTGIAVTLRAPNVDIGAFRDELLARAAARKNAR